jgi:iron complex outermembrane receptor protein
MFAREQSQKLCAPSASVKGLVWLLLTTCSLASVLLSEPALAQTAAQSSAETGNNPAGVETVTVTAERRSESAQNVPVTLNAFSEEALQSQGVTDMNSLSGKVPSLSINNVGPNFYFLRGVGTTNSVVNAEASVATYIDGVYLYDSSYGGQFPLFNLDRVEVLKGPQGTLFGRNTTGGVIQFVTRDPETEPTFEATVGYGNYDTWTGQFYGAGEIADGLTTSLAVDYSDQGTGWGKDPISHQKVFWTKNLSVQSKTVWQPTEGTKVTAFFWYNRFAGSFNDTQVQPGIKGVDGVVSDPGRYEILMDTPDYNSSISYLGYLKIEHDLGFADLVSISAYRHVRATNYLDQDSTPVPLVDSLLAMPASNYSQEVQLLSEPDSKIQWLIGGFFFNATASDSPFRVAGLAAAPFTYIEINAAQHTRSFAGFGQATVPITDDTNITAGFRYTSEQEKKLGGKFIGDGALLASYPDQQAVSDGGTWRLSIDHHFTSDIMGYLSYNRGLKSGGFSLIVPGDLPSYKPEKLDAYELGFKTDWLDNSLRVNAAAFIYKFKDIQVQTIVTGGVFTQNAAQATIKGVDGDFEWNLFDNFLLTGSVGYLNGTYDSFPTADAYPPSPFDGPSFVLDASGNQTVYTPRWSWTLGGTYTIPSSIGNFTADALVQYTDKMYPSPDSNLPTAAFTPAYTIVNASLTWESSDDRYAARLWAKNLFDEKYLASAEEEAVGHLQIPGAPRTYGISVSVKF